jgi:hypothetical protein
LRICGDSDDSAIRQHLAHPEVIVDSVLVGIGAFGGIHTSGVRGRLGGSFVLPINNRCADAESALRVAAVGEKTNGSWNNNEQRDEEHNRHGVR